MIRNLDQTKKQQTSAPHVNKLKGELQEKEKHIRQMEVSVISALGSKSFTHPSVVNHPASTNFDCPPRRRDCLALLRKLASSLLTVQDDTVRDSILDWQTINRCPADAFPLRHAVVNLL